MDLITVIFKYFITCMVNDAMIFSLFLIMKKLIFLFLNVEKITC